VGVLLHRRPRQTAADAILLSTSRSSEIDSHKMNALRFIHIGCAVTRCRRVRGMQNDVARLGTAPQRTEPDVKETFSFNYISAFDV